MDFNACLVCGVDTCERWSDDGKAQHARISERLRDPRHRKWSTIEWRDEDGGRWFLDGRGIHCGDSFELQVSEVYVDDGDEYSLPVQRGIRVRFEVSWTLDARGRDDMFRNGKLPMMHVFVEGVEFKRPIESWMRFRWPARSEA